MVNVQDVQLLVQHVKAVQRPTIVTQTAVQLIIITIIINALNAAIHVEIALHIQSAQVVLMAPS